MIRRRVISRLPTVAVSLLLLASASASISNEQDFIQTPSIEHFNNNMPRRATSSTSTSATSRWLTYACNSHNGNRHERSLLQRILTHPCSSQSRQSTTVSSLYDRNSNKGSSTFVTVTLGILASILTLLILLYFIDRETFTDLTGIKGVNWYCNPTCKKRRLDEEEESENEQSYTNYERDQYLTRETVEYLEEKYDAEVEQPKRRYYTLKKQIKQTLWCCFRPKNYTGDKYHIPWTGSENTMQMNSPTAINKKSTTNYNNNNMDNVHDDISFMSYLEEIRLRLCWRPTKKYNPNVDKYKVGGESHDDGSIRYAASSYESAEEGTAPW